jgi:hypothetical protein
MSNVSGGLEPHFCGARAANACMMHAHSMLEMDLRPSLGFQREGRAAEVIQLRLRKQVSGERE